MKQQTINSKLGLYAIFAGAVIMLINISTFAADYSTRILLGDYKRITQITLGSYPNKGTVRVFLDGGLSDGYWIETNSTQGRNMLSAIELAYSNDIKVGLNYSDVTTTDPGYTGLRYNAVYLIEAQPR